MRCRRYVRQCQLEDSGRCNGRDCRDGHGSSMGLGHMEPSALMGLARTMTCIVSMAIRTLIELSRKATTSQAPLGL